MLAVLNRLKKSAVRLTDLPSHGRRNRLATRRATLSWRRSRKELRWNGTPAAWEARSPKELLSPVMYEKPTNASMGLPDRKRPRELTVKPKGRSIRPLT